jgi:hypothetical protein
MHEDTFNGVSTGTEFYKALADAQLKPNTDARSDLEKIKQFVAENTGFKVVRANITDEGRRARVELQVK